MSARATILGLTHQKSVTNPLAATMRTSFSPSTTLSWTVMHRQCYPQTNFNATCCHQREVSNSPQTQVWATPHTGPPANSVVRPLICHPPRAVRYAGRQSHSLRLKLYNHSASVVRPMSSGMWALPNDRRRKVAKRP